MDKNITISLINPAITLVLAAAFLFAWRQLRDRPYLGMLAAGYTLGAIGFVLRHLMVLGSVPITRLVGNSFFLIGCALLVCAIAQRFRRPVPWIGISVTVVAGLAGIAWTLFVAPSVTWHVYSLNFALGAMCLIAAAELWHVRRDGRAAVILFVMAIMSGVNFIGRTVLMVALHGPFTSYDGLFETTYWTTAVLSHALFSLVIALTLLADAVAGLLAELKSESQTDPLSGLLNRRGFELRGATLLDQCAAANVPMTLIIADLDRFKMLNDSHGHAAGDRVIAGFGALLGVTVVNSGIAARVGGEEFALLLPATDLAAGRLVAEGVRTAFSNQAAAGLPRNVRVTSSFGVAARAPGESLEALLSRADQALYQAKRGGRDSVRLSFHQAAERKQTVPG